jgi:hypothetical protein
MRVIGPVFNRRDDVDDTSQSPSEEGTTILIQIRKLLIKANGRAGVLEALAPMARIHVQIDWLFDQRQSAAKPHSTTIRY